MDTQELNDFLAKHKVEKDWEVTIDKEISIAGYVIRNNPFIVASCGNHHKLFGELPIKALDIAIQLTKQFESIKDQLVKEQVLRN